MPSHPGKGDESTELLVVSMYLPHLWISINLSTSEIMMHSVESSTSTIITVYVGDCCLINLMIFCGLLRTKHPQNPSEHVSNRGGADRIRIKYFFS